MWLSALVDIVLRQAHPHREERLSQAEMPMPMTVAVLVLLALEPEPWVVGS